MRFKQSIILVCCLSIVSCKPGTMPAISNDLISSLAVPERTFTPEPDGIKYIGYAKEFVPIKDALKSGNLENINQLYKQRLGIKKINLFDPNESELNLLGLTELSDLYLLESKTDDAIKSFSVLENAFLDKEDESILVEKSTGIMEWLGDKVSGSATFSEYEFQDFEKVLMLNFKAIAFMLQGDRKAYNVTRRAIDLQNDTREKFSKSIKKSKAALTELQQEVKQKQIEEKKKIVKNKQQGQPLNNTIDNAAGFQGVLDLTKNLNKYFLAVDKKGAALPSAYVNPFGDYMNGIIQEFDSLKNPALRSNALISYRKALELNPRSSVIKKNIAALKSKRKIPSRKRLIHFIVGDGFAPEKKVLQYSVPSATGTMPVRLPIYESDPLVLARRIDIKTVSGKTLLARMSVISNIDALCLRSQKDRRAEDFLDLSATVARTFFEKAGLASLGVWGNIIGNLRDKYTEADTRSWLSLPSALLASRMTISKSIKKVRLIAYDKKWRRIIDKVIEIPEGNGFVYARVIGKSLYVNKSEKLWIDG